MAGNLAGSGADQFPEAERHLRLATVDEECSHCPTVRFRLPDSASPVVDRLGALVTAAMPMRALASDAEGMGIDVLLHILEGYLNELEVYRYDGLPLLNLRDVSAFHLAPADSFEIAD